MSNIVKIDTPSESGFYLSVPYYSQRDNVTEWWRTCNTSSCAMVAEYLHLGSINGSDDKYFGLVSQYGDTTDHKAHTSALGEIGIRSSFWTNLDYKDLDNELDHERPVVIGIAHRGAIEAPQGGHMIVVIGKYKDLIHGDRGYICHDPWGEGFGIYYNLGRPGDHVRYPTESLDKRWLCEGKQSGWGRLFDKPEISKT
ncbi:MAG: C39 family peptidase [Microcoleaceae cyanobacterium]